MTKLPQSSVRSQYNITCHNHLNFDSTDQESDASESEYTSDEENVLGVNAELGYLGANVETSITWNIDDSDFDAKIGTGYEILGLDGSITSNLDLDDFAYQGLDTEVGYTWKVSENLVKYYNYCLNNENQLLFR